MEAPRQNESSRAFWVGLLFWAAICFVAILVRGVRWEEGYERAQVLLDITPYPEGHPHYRWVWNGFSIHYYVTGFFLWLTESATLICGGRQFIATLAIHLPVYGMTWLLARRTAPAHLAALLSFVGSNTAFQSYMPILPWATKATSGIIGMGWAFAVLLALAGGRWRWAGLLFGLMPLIHLGQWPMVLLTSLATAAWLFYQGNRKALRGFGTYAAIGLACCLVFAVAQRAVVVPDPTEGAYYSEKDGQAIWAEYTTHEDMHRALTDWPRFGPLGNSVIAMAAVLLLAWPLALLDAREGSGRWPWLVLFAYALLCTAAIVFARIVHGVTGTDVPYVVVSWMPYRLTIHLSMILIAVVAARAVFWREGRPALCLLAALGWLTLLPLWPLVLPEALAQRYFSTPETALFILGGGAVAGLWCELQSTPRLRNVWAALMAAGGLALLAYHQLAALTVLAGLLVSAADDCWRLTARLPSRTAVVAAVLLAFAGLGHVLAAEWQHREFLPVSDFEATMADYLAAHSNPGDMVLTPLDEHYQMVLDRPVVATFETRQFMSYMQSLATTTDKLFADLYGVKDGHWYDWELWQARTTEDWQELAEAYGFRYVLSKSFHPLDLPERLRGDGLVLYEVPKRGSG